MPGVHRRTTLAALIAISLTCSGCLLFGGTFGESKPNKQYDKRLVKRSQKRSGAGLFVVRVHLHAGHKFVNQRIEWRVRMRALLRRANKIIGPDLRVRLKLASTKVWQRSSGDDSLLAMGEELSKRQTGGPRDLVVGLVTPLALMTSSIHQLGLAQIGGSHMVLRAGQKTYDMSADDAELYVFVHEVGHMFGAEHAKDQRDYMSPVLNSRMRLFGEDTRKKLITAMKRRFTSKPAVAVARPAQTKTSASVAPPVLPTESRQTAQQTDNQIADAIKSAQKQGGGIALIELRGIDGKLVRRSLSSGEEQDRLWILLARAYAHHYAISWAGKALTHVRTPGIDAVAKLKKRLARLRRRYLKGKQVSPEAESSYIRGKRSKN